MAYHTDMAPVRHAWPMVLNLKLQCTCTPGPFVSLYDLIK